MHVLRNSYSTFLIAHHPLVLSAAFDTGHGLSQVRQIQHALLMVDDVTYATLTCPANMESSWIIFNGIITTFMKQAP